jgi:hypothetical protein
MAKMGWMLTGDGFPRRWRNAWSQAISTVSSMLGTDVVPATTPHDVELDLYRWFVHIASINVGHDEKILTKVKKMGLPEIFDAPTRTMEQLKQALIGKKQNG